MWNEIQHALDQSAMRVLTGAASILPGLVALVVVLLLSLAVAAVLSMVLRRSLGGIDFDGKVARWGLSGMGHVSPANSPMHLVIRCVFWCVIFLGFVVGLAALDTPLTSEMLRQTVAFLPNVFAAIALLIAGNLLARFLARGTLIGGVNMNVPYARLLSVGVKWLVLVLATAMALDHLGIGGKIVDLAFGILFGGIVLALALAVGLGSKDLVSRSLERQTSERQSTQGMPEREEHFRHV